MSSRRRLRGRRSPPGPVDSSAAVRGRNWEALPSGRCGGCRWWRCPGSSRCRGLGVVCLVAGGGGAGLLGVSSRLPVRRLPPPMFSTGRSVVMVVSCCLVGWCGSVAGRSLTGATVGRRRMRARAPEHQSQPAQPGSDEDSVGDPQRRRGEELRQERHEPEREQDPAGPGQRLRSPDRYGHHHRAHRHRSRYSPRLSSLRRTAGFAWIQPCSIQYDHRIGEDVRLDLGQSRPSMMRKSRSKPSGSSASAFW